MLFAFLDSSDPWDPIWAAFLFVVAAMALVAKRELPPGVSRLVRVFLPSWRFFDSIGAVPRLMTRVMDASEHWGAWIPGLRRPSMPLGGLLANAEGNYFLVCSGAVERLAQELHVHAETGVAGELELLTSVSYRQVEGLVAQNFSPYVPRGLRVQFKIQLQEGGVPKGDMLLSPVYRLRAPPTAESEHPELVLEGSGSTSRMHSGTVPRAC